MEKKVKSLLSQLNNAIEIVRAIVIILKYAYLKAQTEEDAHSAWETPSEDEFSIQAFL